MDNAFSSFFNWASLGNENGVDSGLESGLRGVFSGIGSIGSHGYGMLRSMARGDNPEGQAWLGIGGGLISAILIQNVAMNKFLDKIGIGRIPIVGTLVKAVSFIGLFMAGRKLTHDLFLQGDGGNTPANLPGTERGDDDDGDDDGDEGSSGGQELLNGRRILTVRTQPHNGSLPQVVIIDDLEDDMFFSDMTFELNAATNTYAVQTVLTDNGETFAPVAFGTGIQGPLSNIPLEALQDNTPVFEAIDHDNDGNMDYVKLEVNQQTFKIAKPETTTTSYHELSIEPD